MADSLTPPEPMAPPRRACLIVNTCSGSYTEQAAQDLAAGLETRGIAIGCRIACPDDSLPTPAFLESEGVDMVAVFGGDGTISGTVKELAGWGGRILPLPGGTMNLLAGRLHGDVDPDTILARVAAGEGRAVRVPIIRCAHGQSLVSISAGPGTRWYHVRETMREGGVGEMLDETGDAVDYTINGPKVACRSPELGRDEGYPLIELVPREEGIAIIAYTADSLVGYLQQGLAIALRRFRDGPHERLGAVDEVELASVAGAPIGLSLDGEPTDGAATIRFALDRCPVEMIATHA